MGVSALHKVLIVTFFSIGFICGAFASGVYAKVASLAGPRPGSDAAVLHVQDYGRSRAYPITGN